MGEQSPTAVDADSAKWWILGGLAVFLGALLALAFFGGSDGGRRDRTASSTTPVEPVEILQRCLDALGHYTDEITGELTPETGAALVAFQVEVGLEPHGVVDEATFDALQSAECAGVTDALVGTNTSAPSDPPGSSTATDGSAGSDESDHATEGTDAGGSTGSEPVNAPDVPE